MLESGHNCTDDSAVKGRLHATGRDLIPLRALPQSRNGSTRVDDPMAEEVRDIRSAHSCV